MRRLHSFAIQKIIENVNFFSIWHILETFLKIFDYIRYI